MLGILKRDLLLMISSKQTIILLIFYIPFLITIVDSFVPEILYFAIIVFYTYLISTMSFTYDITGKSKYIISSLPISRREVVLYKYISTFVYFLAIVVYVGVYLWIINSLKFVSVDYFNLKQIINALPVIMVLTSIVYPVYFRFEPKIAQIVQIFLFVFFFTAVSNTSFTGNKGILKYLGMLQWEYIMIIALAMYILSLLVSMQVYKNRDI
ncbi:MAG: ABC-2 transporter permease [Tissierellales bacterium]